MVYSTHEMSEHTVIGFCLRWKEGSEPESVKGKLGRIRNEVTRKGKMVLGQSGDGRRYEMYFDVAGEKMLEDDEFEKLLAFVGEVNGWAACCATAEDAEEYELIQRRVWDVGFYVEEKPWEEGWTACNDQTIDMASVQTGGSKVDET